MKKVKRYVKTSSNTPQYIRVIDMGNGDEDYEFLSADAVIELMIRDRTIVFETPELSPRTK